MKTMRKINPALYRHLALSFILLVFVYGFYYLYGVYSDYRGERAGKPGPEAVVENQTENGELPVTPPTFYTITPEGNATLDIFSFKEKKNNGADPAGGDKDKPSDYTILGVVKQDRLYLAVRIQADNKIRLIPEGAAINDTYRIKKLEPFSVVVIDGEGLARTYKIFQWQDMKEIRDDEKNEKTN